MKKISLFLLTCVTIFSLFGCSSKGSSPTSESATTTEKITTSEDQTTVKVEDDTKKEEETTTKARRPQKYSITYYPDEYGYDILVENKEFIETNFNGISISPGESLDALKKVNELNSSPELIAIIFTSLNDSGISGSYIIESNSADMETLVLPLSENSNIVITNTSEYPLTWTICFEENCVEFKCEN